ncbi:MAG: Cys-tRNA(Pro) deacylase [Spirochaetales bacterium]
MAEKPKHIKTNAIRLLETKQVPHILLYYDPSDGNIDACSVAEKLQKPPEDLFKTLVCRADKDVVVFCLPGPKELDLKKAAHITGVKKIQLVEVKELLPLTGYLRGGCSPIGMKKRYRTFIDKSCERKPYIIISGGALGIQIQLSPQDLINLIDAEIADLV